MRKDTEHFGALATLASVTLMVLALTFSGGCGDDTEEPIQPEDDAGTNCETDGGTDGGVQLSADTEFAAVRFNTDGTLDTTFGTGGVVKVDLGPGTASSREILWGMAKDGTDRLVLFGGKKGDGDRIDADRVVVRLTANGAVDTTFGTNGVQTLNIANLGDNPRNGIVQADGKIVSSGYTSQPTGVGTQAVNKVVLQRLNDNGSLDNAFGSKGVVNSLPIQPADPVTQEWGMAEAYAAGYQSGKYVTTGYGRAAPTGTVDMVSFRYTSTGQLDPTWGTNGTVTLDLVGDNDRGRNMIVLPDDRVLVVGSGTPAAQNIDAMVVMLRQNGERDTSFAADGYKLYSFDRADEAFYGVALNPAGDRVVAAGYRAGGAEDEDATLLLLPIGGGGTEFVQPVPISETENDRFWSAAFDASGKAYGAGFVTEGTDNLMMVARFNADGSRDTTFGAGGVAKINVVQAGKDETARAVVVQSNGKVVVAGIIEKR
jgi:uncharacterized delta-60 repeat protein